ncbi:MAG TPA: GTPase, partial [Anaerolineae bacterium]|nr:GTPase [Anaerolineae bacterium]
KLFATLDPTTRLVALPGGKEVLFTDTVGFIQKLPTMLVAAFRATLEEITEADVLLHVVDITHRNALQQSRTVGEVLSDLGAALQPMVVALNKIDLFADPDESASFLAEFPSSVAISASKGWGVPDLLARVDELLEQAMVWLTVQLPYSAGALLALFHQRGSVELEEHGPDGTLIEGRIPAGLLGRFRPFIELPPVADE